MSLKSYVICVWFCSQVLKFLRRKQVSGTWCEFVNHMYIDIQLLFFNPNNKTQDLT